MGKIPNGITGPVRGKVGTVIGSSWKGIDYIKAKPRKRGKKRTDNERQNQNRFRDLHNWLQPMLGFLRSGFSGYSPTVEGFNAAKSYNLKNAFVNNSLDPSRVLVSYGPLTVPGNIQCQRSDGDLHITWDTSDTDYRNQLDQVMILAYDPGHQRCFYSDLGEFRKTGKEVLKFVGNLDYHVYVAFKSHDRKTQSNSVYLGMVKGGA
jgi:hypothetical protein